MKWYMIYTKTNCEQKVVSTLLRSGLEAYCPTHYSAQDKGMFKWVSGPLFERRIFACLSDKQLSSLGKLQNIISVFHLGDKPAVIDEQEITALKRFESSFRDQLLKIKFEKYNNASSQTVEAFRKVIDDFLVMETASAKLFLPSLGLMIEAQKIIQHRLENQLNSIKKFSGFNIFRRTSQVQMG